MATDGGSGTLIEAQPPVAQATAAWAPPTSTRRAFHRPFVAWTKTTARRALAAAAVVGVGVDQVFNTTVVGLAGTVTIVIAAVGLLAVLPITRGRSALILMVVALAPWLTIRASPWLSAPTVLGCLTLLGLAARSPGRRLDRFIDLGATGIDAIEAFVNTPVQLYQAITAATPAGTRSQVRRTLPALVVGVSLGLVLIALLASGDQLFATYVSVPSAGNYLSHLAPITFAAIAWMVLVITARHPIGSDPTARAYPGRARSSTARLSGRDAGIVLTVVAVVLAGYTASLISGAIGGPGYVLRQTGLTYAQYARSGFFQMVAVVVIVGMLLLGTRNAVSQARRRRGLLAGMALACGGLTIVMAGVSVTRLQTYRTVFGLTMLRWSTTAFAVWLAIVVAMICASLFSRALARHLVRAVVVSAYVALMYANVANPESVVAAENMDRLGQVGSLDGSIPDARFDGDYLGGLSADAVPTIAARIAAAPASEAAVLRNALCAATHDDPGWSVNLARRRAQDAVAAICRGR